MENNIILNNDPLFKGGYIDVLLIDVINEVKENQKENNIILEFI